METKLNTFGRVNGWVFGAWGEASEDVHALVQRLAKAKLERLDTLPTARRRQISRAAMLASLVGDVPCEQCSSKHDSSWTNLR